MDFYIVPVNQIQNKQNKTLMLRTGDPSGSDEVTAPRTSADVT